MSFFDKLKQQATDVASTVAEKTQETARYGQLKVQLRTLESEEKDALADYGRQAHALHEQGALAERSGELAAASAKIADLRSQIAAKQAEITAVKGADGEDGGAAADTVDGNAEEVADPPAEDPGPGAAGDRS
jgi:chromosome segregation ATPase